MKDSLMIKKYQTEDIFGTYNLLDEKSFFGTILIDIEDNINISDSSIQYFQKWLDGDPNNPVEQEEMKNNGYQYFKMSPGLENLTIIDVVKIKNDNHKIYKILQNDIDEKYNTRWELNIDIKKILIEYLFGKIKEARTFKSMDYSVFMNNNINDTIYKYIELNMLDRFEFFKIDLYIEYIDIKKNSSYNLIVNKQFDPIYTHHIKRDEFKITNVNMKQDLYLDKLAPLDIFYYQTKPSSEYRFNYYFDISYKKI